MTGPVRQLFVVAGVSGSGKTTLAAALAERLGLHFIEGDDLHPPENRAAMRAGQPLDDAMRAGWLDRIAAALAAAPPPGTVVSCSALKRSYRDRLRQGAGASLRFLCLSLPEAELRRRMLARQGHFMPVSLLASQLATWQPPAEDESDACILDATLPVDRQLGLILRQI